MPIDSSKFSSNSLTGTVRVLNGFANISLPTAFYALEGNISFNVAVRTDSVSGAVIFTSPTITLKDTSSFVSLTANTATVNEGDLVAFTLVTANALGNSTLYYSVFPATANVTSADFVANTGSFLLTNNTGTFTLKANSDLSLVNETGENFKVQLRTVSTTGNVVYTSSNIAIADTSNAYNILTFAPTAVASLENSNVTFTFSATNVPFGTVFYYETTGNVTVTANTGSFVLNSLSNTFTVSAGSVSTSATRAFTVNLRAGASNAPIVATSNTAYVIDSALAYTQATGGNITTSGGYRIHTFTTSGNLIVSAVGIPNTVEYLVVAGGGGGQRGDSVWSSGGGGGAGGYLTANLAISSESPITVIVGAGGGSGTAGSNSTFSSITSTGGGTGGKISPEPSNNGGSGGGDSGYAGGKGTGIAGQGNPGGLGYGSQRFGGGGGGAGAVGGDPTGTGGIYGSPSIAGVGGIGLQSSISGSAIYYAGGGGGGARAVPGEATYYAGDGGTGGGGAGQYSSGPSAVAGTVNRGGGGGGAGAYGPGVTVTSGGSGAAGGSGIVIIRYPFVEPPTYTSLTTTSNFTYETLNAVFTLNTLNLANNTLLYYTTVGNIISADFVSGNTGSFRTTGNASTITLATNSNIPTNQERYFQLQIRADSLTEPVVATSNVFTIKDILLQPFSLEYIVVAGGGGGGNGGTGNGGNGAGGGGLLKGTATVTGGVTYTIVVGAGGARNVRGANSSITASGFTTQNSIGGGGGFNNMPGGSGGGGSLYWAGAEGTAYNYPSPAPAFYTPTGAQGYPGGSAAAPRTSASGGGGGGAGGAGTATAPSGNTGAAGGSGYTWPNNGSTYAAGGGGGGGMWPPQGAAGPGGNGGSGSIGGNGGGPSGDGESSWGTAGAAGTGSGGGGGNGGPGFQPGSWYSGAGGGGIVAIAIPTPAYPGSAPGATVTTPGSAPGKTVITFTSSGTLIL